MNTGQLSWDSSDLFSDLEILVLKNNRRLVLKDAPDPFFDFSFRILFARGSPKLSNELLILLDLATLRRPLADIGLG